MADFVSGSFTIAISNFITKILGVVFKIPLANMLQDNMEMFTAAYSVYAMLYMLSTAGLPVAVSRTVAVSAAKGRRKEENRVFGAGTVIFGVMGVTMMLVMLIWADKIAAFSEHNEAAAAIRVIAPSLPLVGLSSAIRGYFQGHREMGPTACFHLIEASVKTVAGLAGAYYAVSNGFSSASQAAYAISGITVGSAAAMVYLIIRKYFYDKKHKEFRSLECDGYKEIYKTLIKVAVPVAITSTALYLSNFIDTVVIKKCLISSGVAEDTAGRLYTAYASLSQSVSDILPATLVYPIAMSVLPSIAGAFTEGDIKSVKNYVHSSIYLSALLGLPCTAGMFVLARQVLVTLYGANWGSRFIWNGVEYSSVDIATNGLRILAIGIIFMSLLSTTNALLPAIKKSHLPMISVCSGVVVLLGLEIGLVSVESIGIYGAPIASLGCYTVAIGLNLYFIKKAGYLEESLLSIFSKPLLCSLVCGAAAFGGSKLAELVFSSDSRSDSIITLLAGTICGVAAYLAAVVVFRAVRAEDIASVKKLQKLAYYLKKRGILK